MSKRKHLDQYYTQPEFVEQCVETIRRVVPDWAGYTWTDFSAGDNTFLRKLGVSDWHAYDLEPRHKDVAPLDWFRVTTSYYVPGKRRAVGFNPPYGTMGYEARRFIKHAMDALAPEVFAVIAPRRAWGWLLTCGYKIAHVSMCPPNSFYTDEDSGDRKAFTYNVPFVVLVPAPASAPAPEQPRRFVKSLAFTGRCTLEEQDVVFSFKGDDSVFKHVMIRDSSGWQWFVRGVPQPRIAGPLETSLSMAGQSKMAVTFTSDVTEEQKRRIAAELHTLADYAVCGMVTPACYTLEQVRCILEKFVQGVQQEQASGAASSVGLVGDAW